MYGPGVSIRSGFQSLLCQGNSQTRTQPTGTLRRRTASLYNLGEHCVTHKYIKRTLRPQELFLCINLNLSTAMQVGEVLIKTEVSFLVGRKPFNLCCSGDTPAILRSQQLLLHSAEILLETVLSPWTNRNDSSSKIHLHLHYSSPYTAWGKESQGEVSFKTYLETYLEYQLII